MLTIRRSFLLSLFLAVFLIPGAAAVAEQATVTNNGTVDVRVRIFNEGATGYVDLGYLKPGESLDVPGGVEKIKIDRDWGQWARPLRPGEVIGVEVKEGSQSLGTMTYWGDKVFFDGISDGPPFQPAGAAASVPAPAAEADKPAPPPESPPLIQAAPNPAAPNWPWMGGAWNFLFPVLFIVLWLPFLWLWFRHAGRNRYYLGNQWVPQERLGWNWAWKQESRTCAWLGIILGILLGFSLGTLAVWAAEEFGSSGTAAFLEVVGYDLYALPVYLLGGTGLLEVLTPGFGVILFWVMLCGLIGFGGGLMPMKWLYALPCLALTAPFFLMMRGCAGPQPFGLDGGYGGSLLYPAAFAAGTSFICLLADYILDLVDPYYEMDEDEEEDVHDAVHDFFEGNPWPLMVALAGGCVSCFYDTAYYYGWDHAIARFFHSVPIAVMGGMNLPFNLLHILFWMGLFGGLGWTFFKTPQRGLFYLTLIPAFFVLIFLSMGAYPQRQIRGLYPPDSGMNARLRLGGYVRGFGDGGGFQGDPAVRNLALRELIDPQLLRAAGGQKPEVRDAVRRFGDDLKLDVGAGYNLGGDIRFDGGGKVQAEETYQQKD